MKKRNNNITISQQTVLAILSILFLILPASAMDITDAPESVTIDYLQDLYTAVNFDHQMHAETYSCNICHHHTTGDGPQNAVCQKCHANSEAAEDVSCSGCHLQKKTLSVLHTSPIGNTFYHIDKPGIKGAFHLQCLGCHQTEGGPTGCQECHSFTPAGHKRFATKE